MIGPIESRISDDTVAEISIPMAGNGTDSASKDALDDAARRT